MFSNSAKPFKALAKVCGGNDLEQIRPALLCWGQSRWPQQRPISLPQLLTLAPTLNSAVNELNSHRYGSALDNAWQGQPLLQAVENIRKHSGEQRQQPVLAPLYSR